MREKLTKIIEAYEDVQAKMGDPAVLADQKEYNRLAKEYANQGPLAKKAREYVQAADDLAEAREMLADPDMKEFALEEIAGIEAKLPALEEDIKFMLIPADPADDKGHHRRDPRSCRRRRGGHLRGRSCTRCTSGSRARKAGRPRRWTCRPPKPAASRRSSSRSKATTCTRS